MTRFVPPRRRFAAALLLTPRRRFAAALLLTPRRRFAAALLLTPRRRFAAALRCGLAGACGAWLVLSACSAPAADARVREQLPDRTSFPVVAQMLVHHCGTLDCHGMSGRNLRLFGNEGLRWAPSDRPLTPACTTADEIEQDYDAVVGLEPEVMSAVIADDGAHPERLSLVRKARGAEHHKGGTLIRAGDDADDCLTSWLAGAANADACLRAQLESLCFGQDER